jgi:hypothetical protein
MKLLLTLCGILACPAVADDWVYPIYTNGVDPVPVPRVPVDGPLTEVAYSIPAAQVEVGEYTLEESSVGPAVRVPFNGVTVSGGTHTHTRTRLRKDAMILETHTHIHTHSLLIGFAREMHQLDEKAAGVIRMNPVRTPNSLFPGTKWMWAIKTHSVTHEGWWSEATTERVTAERNARTVQEEATAKEMNQLRAAASLTYISNGVGSSFTYAGLDLTQRALLRASVANATQEASPLTELLKSAEQGFEDSKTKESVRADNTCFHFEPVEGMVITEESVLVPLNTQVVSYRGVTSFAPFRRCVLLSLL